MTADQKAVGRWGEDQAEAYLLRKGYEVIARNVRTPYGELDLIVRREGRVIFVEVKTRTSTSFGFPEEAVTARKRDHLLWAAQAYLQEHAELEGDWQIDVLAIRRQRAGPPEILHFENVVHEI